MTESTIEKRRIRELRRGVWEFDREHLEDTGLTENSRHRGAYVIPETVPFDRCYIRSLYLHVLLLDFDMES